MKNKVLCLILAVVVLCGMNLPVSAAGSAHMSIQSSSGTVYRGESFVLTVSLTNEQPVSNGGVMLSFDSSAFAILGGSCNVSNAALAEVSAANGGGVFVLQTDAVVSGTIFTIQMQVKEDAPFGSYTISGTPSLSVSCSLSGTGITVACRHVYEDCSAVDSDSHVRTCSVCGDQKTEEHVWDSGKVIQMPTCKDTGRKEVTCTECGAVTEQTVPVTEDHTYGSWSQNDQAKHTHSCGVCGKTETAAHTWNSGTVIKQATCQETGSQKLTCTGCGAEKTETVPQTAHVYGTAVSVDSDNHKSICKNCGKEDIFAHRYAESWESDENGHFFSCEDCGQEKDRAAHEPGPKATETTDQTCTVCSYILQPMGKHVHSFAQAWSTDETGHWHACSDCNEKDSAGAHAFDSGCDTDCNVCGMKREPTHIPSEKQSSDARGHWYACQNCGEEIGLEAHVPGPAATIKTAQVCTVCQFELAPMIPHDHVFDGEGTLHRHLCVCGEFYEAEADICGICASFPWWIVCILEAVVFGGVIAWLLTAKKKSSLKNERAAEEEHYE